MSKINAHKLQSIAQEAIVVQIIRENAKKMFPTIALDNDLHNIAVTLNEYISVAQYSGQSVNNTIKQSILLMLKEHKSTEVRKLVATLLSENLLSQMMFDRSDVVRSVVAKRIAFDKLTEMHKKFPQDCLLEEIYDSRALNTIGGKKDIIQIEMDKNPNDIELSDTWYKSTARRILEDYGEYSYGSPIAIERHWNPLAVVRFCKAYETSCGIKINQEKLQKAVDETLKELDDVRIDPNKTFRNIKESLREACEQDEAFSIPILEIVEENKDAINDLLSCRSTTSVFNKLFEEKFNVTKKELKVSFQQLRENIDRYGCIVPFEATNIRSSFDRDVEVVVEAYVSKFNKANCDKGIELSWFFDPQSTNKIIFETTVK